MKKSVFLSGIGGIGMANVAVLLREAGYEVSGSDGQIYEPAVSILRAAGILVKSPYAAENLPHDNTPVIIGNAQSRGHVEVEEALDSGMPMYSFPEFLSRFILPGRHSIVVAGTHGKSTTTACLSHLLEVAGHNPGFLIGALPLDFPQGGRLGNGSAFVIEGDEYDSAFFDKRSKFLHYFPRTLLLGTVEYDHADIFPTMDDMLLSFRRLLRLLPRNGKLIHVADCEATVELAAAAPCPTTSVGTNDTCAWQLLPDINGLAFRDPSGAAHHWRFDLPGQHNRLNALMSLAATMSFGGELPIYEKGLATFRGLRRRLETLYTSEVAVVYDDFAHHPTAIASAIQAIREKYPKWHLMAVCEPRSNTMVRNVFQKKLENAFAGADDVIFGSIHRQDRIPAEQRLDISALMHRLEKQGIRARQMANSELVDVLAGQITGAPTVFLFLSNGGFGNVPQKFVNYLSSRAVVPSAM